MQDTGILRKVLERSFYTADGQAGAGMSECKDRKAEPINQEDMWVVYILSLGFGAASSLAVFVAEIIRFKRVKHNSPTHISNNKMKKNTKNRLSNIKMKPRGQGTAAGFKLDKGTPRPHIRNLELRNAERRHLKPLLRGKFLERPKLHKKVLKNVDKTNAETNMEMKEFTKQKRQDAKRIIEAISPPTSRRSTSRGTRQPAGREAKISRGEGDKEESHGVHTNESSMLPWE